MMQTPAPSRPRRPSSRIPRIAARLTTCAATLCASAIGLHAQCDPDYEVANTLPGVGYAAFDAAAWDPDGTGPMTEHIVLVGRIEVAGTLKTQAPVAYNPISRTFTALGQTTTNPPLLTRVAADSAGRLFVGNEDSIQQWNGSGWTTVALPNGVTSSLRAMTITGSGALVFAGIFSSVNGTPIDNIAMWDGTNVQPIGNGLPQPVDDVLQLANGDLVACGAFGVMQWDGNAWFPLSTSTDAVSATAAAELPNGDIAVAGWFSGTRGVGTYNGTWTQIASGAYITSLATLPTGDLIAAGPHFVQFMGQQANHIARWDGNAWHDMNGGVDEVVLGLDTMQNGGLVVAGGFRKAGGRAACGIATWENGAWQRAGDGLNHSVHALCSRSDGTIVLGGRFSGLGTTQGTPANHIAVWTGGNYLALGDGLDNTVDNIVETSAGDLVAAGSFHNSGNAPMQFLARWHQGAWQAFGDPNLPVYALAALTNGDLVIGGGFSSLAGQVIRRIARFDGTSWSELGGGIPSGAVEDIVELTNGDLVVGGWFNVAGPIAANNVARWDGTAWQPMSGGLPVVRDLLLTPDGRLLAATDGGTFLWANGVWQPFGTGHGKRLATLPNGDIVRANNSNTYLNPTYGANLHRWNGSNFVALTARIPGSIHAMLATADDELLVAGDFLRPGDTLSSGVASPYLVRIAAPCRATAAPLFPGCSSSAGPVTLRLSSKPWLGTNITSTTTGVPSNAITIAAWGLSTTNVLLSNTLPSTTGCRRHISNPQLTIASGPPGIASTTVAIPTNPYLIGVRFYHQTFTLELAGGNIVDASASNTYELQLGVF